MAALEPFEVAGLSLRGTQDANFEALWEEVNERSDELFSHAVADETYGVTIDADEETGEFTYLAGVVVESTEGLPDDASVVEVPGGTYAVFEATLDDIDGTYEWIMNEWVAKSAFEIRDAPFIERYGSEWGPETAFEVLVPVTEG